MPWGNNVASLTTVADDHVFAVVKATRSNKVRIGIQSKRSARANSKTNGVERNRPTQDPHHSYQRADFLGVCQAIAVLVAAGGRVGTSIKEQLLDVRVDERGDKSRPGCRRSAATCVASALFIQSRVPGIPCQSRQHHHGVILPNPGFTGACFPPILAASPQIPRLDRQSSQQRARVQRKLAAAVADTWFASNRGQPRQGELGS